MLGSHMVASGPVAGAVGVAGNRLIEAGGQIASDSGSPAMVPHRRRHGPRQAEGRHGVEGNAKRQGLHWSPEKSGVGTVRKISEHPFQIKRSREASTAVGRSSGAVTGERGFVPIGRDHSADGSLASKRMLLKSEPNIPDEQTFEALRSRCRNALIGEGESPDHAERWCDAWEAEAARQGTAHGPYYWDSGRGWIDAQRESWTSLDS